MGQGKLSFLELIKEELILEKESKVISYDASIYNEKEEIWIQVIKILFDYFEKESKFNKLNISWKNSNKISLISA